MQLPQLLATPKSIELVNASQSSAIVRLRLAPSGAGVAKVIDLAEPIPPASIQQFWRYLPTLQDSPTSSVCLVYFTAGYASGSEADIPNVDLCHDNQILAVERVPSSATGSGPPASPSRAMGSYAAALLESLDLYADPSRRFVRLAKVSADGSKVVTVADNRTVQLWESSGRLIASLAGDGFSVEAAVFSPDGREVITFARGSLAQSWDTETGREISRSGPKPTTTLASGGYALSREVVLRSDASGGVGDTMPPESTQALPGERRLAAGSQVEMVQAYGAWTLITAGGDLGYVPSSALVRGGTTAVPRILIAGATQANDDIRALERRIEELTSAGGYAEAAVLAARYSEAVKLRYGSEHLQFAAALDTQAQLAHVANRLSEAELLYRRAIAIREKALGACDPTVASGLDRLEQLYRAQGHLDFAQSLARRSQLCLR